MNKYIISNFIISRGWKLVKGIKDLSYLGTMMLLGDLQSSFKSYSWSHEVLLFCLKETTYNVKQICIIEVYNLLKYYFESHLIYKWRYYRQTIFNQLNIMVPYVYLIGVCHCVVILREIYVMQSKYHVR